LTDEQRREAGCPGGRDVAVIVNCSTKARCSRRIALDAKRSRERVHARLAAERPVVRQARRKNVQTLRFLLTGWAVFATTPGTWSALKPMGVASANAQTFIARAAAAYADIPGARIYYTDTSGSGTAVVFMHAGTGSSLVLEYQRPAFIGAGYRFIACDRLGYGRSEIDPPGAQPGTAADDLEALMKHLRGDADLFTPPAVLRLFSARIKTSASVLVPEAGHSAYWEQPEMFNRAVLDFVRQH